MIMFADDCWARRAQRARPYPVRVAAEPEPAPAQLLRRAAVLAGRPGRAILGITGPPAAGKSTLAHSLVAQLAPRAAYVPLDGFHLAHQLLVELGRVARKGAPDTFDAGGYAALLRRLRDPGEDVVYAPKFVREIEDSIANAIPVQPDVPLVITEGNYLLVPSGPWAGVSALLDEVWYLDLPEEVRLQRLIGRHMAFGRDAAEARSRATGSDQRNAVLIEATRERADLVISLPSGGGTRARELSAGRLRMPAPELAEQPGRCLGLAVAGEDPLWLPPGRCTAVAESARFHTCWSAISGICGRPAVTSRAAPPGNPRTTWWRQCVQSRPGVSTKLGHQDGLARWAQARSSAVRPAAAASRSPAPVYQP